MAKRSCKCVPWSEWKVSFRLRSSDIFIDDDGVRKYVEYRIGLRSKATDCVSVKNLKVLRVRQHNVQEEVFS